MSPDAGRSSSMTREEVDRMVDRLEATLQRGLDRLATAQRDCELAWRERTHGLSEVLQKQLIDSALLRREIEESREAQSRTNQELRQGAAASAEERARIVRELRQAIEAEREEREAAAEAQRVREEALAKQAKEDRRALIGWVVSTAGTLAAVVAWLVDKLQGKLP